MVVLGGVHLVSQYSGKSKHMKCLVGKSCFRWCMIALYMNMIIRVFPALIGAYERSCQAGKIWI